jgi:hypothetical protein
LVKLVVFLDEEHKVEIPVGATNRDLTARGALNLIAHQTQKKGDFYLAVVKENLATMLKGQFVDGDLVK